jgi:hypothetical protein
MSEASQAISKLLHEAAETHHRVYQIVDGADPDWATWYADWLVNLSPLRRERRSALLARQVVMQRDQF